MYITKEMLGRILLGSGNNICEDYAKAQEIFAKDLESLGIKINKKTIQKYIDSGIYPYFPLWKIGAIITRHGGEFNTFHNRYKMEIFWNATECMKYYKNLRAFVKRYAKRHEIKNAAALEFYNAMFPNDKIGSPK